MTTNAQLAKRVDSLVQNLDRLTAIVEAQVAGATPAPANTNAKAPAKAKAKQSRKAKAAKAQTLTVKQAERLAHKAGRAKQGDDWSEAGRARYKAERDRVATAIGLPAKYTQAAQAA